MRSGKWVEYYGCHGKDCVGQMGEKAKCLFLNDTEAATSSRMEKPQVNCEDD